MNPKQRFTQRLTQRKRELIHAHAVGEFNSFTVEKLQRSVNYVKDELSNVRDDHKLLDKLQDRLTLVQAALSSIPAAVTLRVYEAQAVPADDECPYETSAEEIAHGVETHAHEHGWSATRVGSVVTLAVTEEQFKWLTDGECEQCEWERIDRSIG